MAHCEYVRSYQQVDFFDLEGVDKGHVHFDKIWVKGPVFRGDVIFYSEAALMSGVMHHRLCDSGHQSRVNVSKAPSRDLSWFWIPESSCVVNDEAKPVRIVVRLPNFDADVRRVVPEDEPADNSEDQVAPK